MRGWRVWQGDCEFYGRESWAGKAAHMKKILFLAVLVIGCSVPAFAQHGGGSAGPGSNGGGGYGGGFGGGSLSGGGTLPSCPPTQFAVVAVSGSNAEWEPSTFVSFEKAVAFGKQMIVIESRTVAEAARENNAARREKARMAVVQDGNSYPEIDVAR